jgi:hypothetical protein
MITVVTIIQETVEEEEGLQRPTIETISLAVDGKRCCSFCLFNQGIRI